jgi:hypothetical protein
LDVSFRSGVLTAAWTALALLVCFSSPLHAQSYRGSIRGTVYDPSGAVIPNASITAKEKASGLTRTVTSGDDGGYVIPELPAGVLEITAKVTGFKVFVAPAIVEVGRDTTLDITMAIGGADTITVGATPPIVETTEDVLGGVVEQRLVDELPLNGRDFGKLVALVPGVVVEGSGVAGTEKGFGQFNVNGNRDRSNNYTLDGTDNNDPWFNNSALNQVGITGAPASAGGCDSGVQSAVTISGRVWTQQRRCGEHHHEVRHERSSWVGIRVLPEFILRRAKLFQPGRKRADPVYQRSVRRVAGRSDREG